jgi:glycosyltransferase involved in cell wall biosynthesis
MQPLVTVGIPTRERPAGLQATLTNICGQSYKNLEILVSDNASQGRGTADVMRAFERYDERVKTFHQRENIGPLGNFDFLLKQASGTYFMWAADDDEWEPWFVERCVNELENAGKRVVAAITEGQYFTSEGPCEFFPEGRPFHERTLLEDAASRVAFLLDNNYGNLFYSVFRREALFSGTATVFYALRLTSLNEIPVLLHVAAQGDWIVLPEVGFRKQTRLPTYKQAKWERAGGWLAKECRATSLRSLLALHGYHAHALQEIRRSIDCLQIADGSKTALRRKAATNIWLHLLWTSIGYKP